MTIEKRKTQDLVDLVLKKCRHYGADEAAVSIQAGRSGLTRFARNRIIQNVETESMVMTIAVAIGQREAALSTSVMNPESIDQSVQDAITMAKMYPPNPEHISPVQPVEIPDSNCFDSDTAEFSQMEKAQIIKRVSDRTAAKKLMAFGTLTTGYECTAFGNSTGHRLWHPETTADFSLTIRTDSGDGSCRENRGFHTISNIDFEGLIDKCCDWARWSTEAQYLEPGDYTVILTPTAALNYLMWAFFTMDSRKVSEGRSALSTHFNVKDPIGQKLFSSNISVFSRTNHPEYPAKTFGAAMDMDFGGQGVVGRLFSDGLPVQDYPIIENGVQKELFSSLYWARKNNLSPKAFPNLIEFSGTDDSIDQLVAQTKRGILINSFWYIRFVDPNRLLLTGLTRDGVFLVEDGAIVKPLKNMRFNESPLVSLANVEKVGKPEIRRAWFNDILIPSMVVNDFSFTSDTAAI